MLVRIFVNSLLISALRFDCLVVSFLAAYAFSRFKLKSTSLIMFFLLSIRMVRLRLCNSSFFYVWALGWKDTYPV
jgi:multiple sugar transport system permease protein